MNKNRVFYYEIDNLANIITHQLFLLLDKKTKYTVSCNKRRKKNSADKMLNNVNSGWVDLGKERYNELYKMVTINRHFYGGTAFNQELLKMYKVRLQGKHNKQNIARTKNRKVKCYDDLNPPVFDDLKEKNNEEEDNDEDDQQSDPWIAI